MLKGGVVKLHSVDSSGDEKVLLLLSSPMVLPLAFYARPGVTTRWQYTALTDCDMFVLPRKALDRVMEQDTESMHFLMQNYSNEVREVLLRLESLGKSDATSKLIIALRYLAAYHSEHLRGNWWRVSFPVSQQLLADLTGVSRETISIAMRTLMDGKVVRSPRLTVLEVNTDRLASYRPHTVKVREAI